MDSASDFESEGCGFDPHPRCFLLQGRLTSQATITHHIFHTHGSSVGRAGDCNSDSAVIPRPVVRFRPVRFFLHDNRRVAALPQHGHGAVRFHRGDDIPSLCTGQYSMVHTQKH